MYLKGLETQKRYCENQRSDFLFVEPLKDNLWCWHFTIRGPKDSEFEGGLYHGYLDLPSTYPFNPFQVYFLNENGRFAINRKICFDATSDPNGWTPAWTVHSFVEALSTRFLIKEVGTSEGGHLITPPAHRMELARKSREWSCDHCGPLEELEKKRWKD